MSFKIVAKKKYLDKLFLIVYNFNACPDGETGIRARLRI